MIEARNLFRIESKLKKGDKTIPVKSIEKDYVISWILIGIAKSETYDILCFKGGTAIKKFYFPDYRFSEDLDFTLLKHVSIEKLKQILQEVYIIVLDFSNIRLALKSRETYTNTFTFYINFSGPLGADLTRGEIKTDITINEKLIYQPTNETLLREYNEYHDIPENIKLKVYSLEEIFMEKYLSILDVSRNEPRDIYDLWYLVSHECLEFGDLDKQIREKGNYKGMKFFDIIEMFNRKENNYRKLWTVRLDKHVVDLPPFEKIYRELRRFLKPLNRALVK
ncbi:MAG: nucleotidyl transferase AbiEii/AbiGii toxin family protein [candidate division WOR-3 bacterium]|nr:MAG: nucleotidyl transferase AbiEii/AbiGii toxin family protein [candidate division WOR-3 bacterium]